MNNKFILLIIIVILLFIRNKRRIEEFSNGDVIEGVYLYTVTTGQRPLIKDLRAYDKEVPSISGYGPDQGSGPSKWLDGMKNRGQVEIGSYEQGETLSFFPQETQNSLCCIAGNAENKR